MWSSRKELTSLLWGGGGKERGGHSWYRSTLQVNS